MREREREIIYSKLIEREYKGEIYIYIYIYIEREREIRYLKILFVRKRIIHKILSVLGLA